MLPCRPLPALRTLARARALHGLRVAACSLVLLSGALATPAHAFKITSIRPARDAGNQLWVEIRLEDPIEDRVAASLGKGMPATLNLHAELWRRRAGWFDRMERESDATFRMHYDVWSDTWRLSRPNMEMLRLSSLDSLEIALARTLALNVSPLSRFSPDASMYVVISASLRPLDVKDVEEVELWLSGEVKEKKRRPLGILTGLPLSLFDAARNLAGFGDEHSRLISADFTPLNLPRFTH